MDRRQGGVMVVVLVAVLAMGASAQAQGGITDMKQGGGGSAVQGSAGPGGAQDAASDLARCETPMAAVAVVEPQSHILAGLSRHGLGSPTSLIRLMIQQSNCFIVVERGVGMQNMMQERALARGGELKQDSNVGGGQMVSADYILTPAVIFSEDNAGGVGGAAGGVVGGLFGRGAGAVVGGIAGGLKFKEAQTSMLVADTRSGIQVAAAEGSARKADFRLGGLLGGAGSGGGGAVAAGGYSNTNEGKIIAASLADNYNGVVRAVRGNPSLQRSVGSLATEAAARTKAGATYNEGDVLRPKIANIRLFSRPADDAPSTVTLGKSDELIFMGKEQDGYINVETSKGSGWVRKVLITR